MERGGELSVDTRNTVVYVFDGLIANCLRPKAEKWAVRRLHWEDALAYWQFDARVCNHMYQLMSKYLLPVEVITWHPHGFARVLADRLWDMDLPVRDVIGGEFKNIQQNLAMDKTVSTIYDPDPRHRLSYGFKARGVDEWLT